MELPKTINDFSEIKEYIHLNRNEIGRCPCCNGNIKDRTVSIYKGLVESMYKVYCYLGEKRKHEFKMKEIKHLLSKNDYARFGDLVRFGGILYKAKDEEGKREKGRYGMNMKRAKEFFNGERTIPMQIVIDQIKDEILEKTQVGINDIPELTAYLTENGLYDYERKLDPPTLF